MRILQIGFVTLLAAFAAACSANSDAYQPTTEEMRSALLTLMNQQPDISIPEFKNALEYDTPYVRKGIVFIGPWNCDPKLQTFEALFTAPNLTLYEVSGRFEMSPAGVWAANPRRVLTLRNRDIGEFWRAHEIDPAFQEPR